MKKPIIFATMFLLLISFVSAEDIILAIPSIDLADEVGNYGAGGITFDCGDNEGKTQHDTDGLIYGGRSGPDTDASLWGG